MTRCLQTLLEVKRQRDVLLLPCNWYRYSYNLLNVILETGGKLIWSDTRHCNIYNLSQTYAYPRGVTKSYSGNKDLFLYSFICSDRLSNVTIELYFIVHAKWNFGQHPKVCMYFFSCVTGDYGHNSVTSWREIEGGSNASHGNLLLVILRLY